MSIEKFKAELLLYVSELSDRSSPEDQPDMMLVTGRELEDGIELALERSGMALVPVLGQPMDPRFIPTHRDLIALREDAAAMRGAGVPATVNVAPRVLYVAWPNGQYDPTNPESTRWRCVSFDLPE